MILRSALPSDFAFIRGLAQDPAYAPFITDEEEEAQAAYLLDPSARLLIWGNTTPAGFALFGGIGAPGRVVELRRLALAKPGRGEGAAFLAALIAYGFDTLQADRLWLDASGENLRAQRAYEKAGFTLEGQLRAHWYRPALGRCVDLMLYGILRDEARR